MVFDKVPSAYWSLTAQTTLYVASINITVHNAFVIDSTIRYDNALIFVSKYQSMEKEILQIHPHYTHRIYYRMLQMTFLYI